MSNLTNKQVMSLIKEIEIDNNRHLEALWNLTANILVDLNNNKITENEANEALHKLDQIDLDLLFHNLNIKGK